MASSGNFATFNPLKYKASSYTTSSIVKGNRQLGSKTGNAGQLNFGFKNGDGKYYFEAYGTTIPSSFHYGVCIGNADLNNVTAGKAIIGYRDSGNKVVSTAPQTNSTQSSYGASYTGGDVMGCAVDFTNGTIEFYKNNTSQGSIDWSSANDGSTYYPYVYQNTGVATINTGQDSTFCGQLTAGNNADENGFGDFKYSPPSGFLAMCSANLPISDDIDPNLTDDNYPSKLFDAVTYTGNGSSQNIQNLNFQPDLVWIKCRSSAGENRLTDSSRGANKSIITSTTNGQLTDNGCTAFNSDGFSVGSNSDYNASSNTYVAWCWKAGGGSTSSNSDGSITTNVQSSTAGGFSIITYTGTGANATIGHGLTKAPTFVMCKNLDDTDYFGIYHKVTGATHYGTLPSSSAPSANSTFWNNTAPTNSVISLGSQNRVNGSSNNMVCYAWHDVDGYSSFGSFVGNSNNDGTFVALSFRPRLLFIRNTQSTSPWVVYDGVRSGSNPADQQFWESNLADHTSYPLDLLSNGFKLRTSNATVNSSHTWLFGAWGDVPYKYNNTF